MFRDQILFNANLIHNINAISAHSWRWSFHDFPCQQVCITFFIHYRETPFPLPLTAFHLLISFFWNRHRLQLGRSKWNAKLPIRSLCTQYNRRPSYKALILLSFRLASVRQILATTSKRIATHLLSQQYETSTKQLGITKRNSLTQPTATANSGTSQASPDPTAKIPIVCKQQQDCIKKQTTHSSGLLYDMTWAWS